MAFKFEIDESFAKAIPRIAVERIERVIHSLAERPRPSAESIHSARKDLKSLRALLRLGRGSIPDEMRRNENLLFRDSGRSLSALRDSHALVESLKKFAKSRPRSNSKNLETRKESGLNFIHKVRAKIEQEAVRELPEATLKLLKTKLRETIPTTERWFDGLSFQPENEWEVFVGRGLRRTYRLGRNIVDQIENLGKQNTGDETWHELRKCAKALGYQIRLFRPVWPELLGTLLDGIDQLTEKLGDDHDLAVLRSRILHEPYGASEMQKAAEIRRSFIESLDRRRRKFQTEALQIARRIYVEKPGQFANRIHSYWSISQTPAKFVTSAPRQVPGPASRKEVAQGRNSRRAPRRARANPQRSPEGPGDGASGDSRTD